MTYTVTLPTGDEATASTLEGACLAMETMLEDIVAWLRDDTVVKRDGVYDAAATTAVQSKGLLV